MKNLLIKAIFLFFIIFSLVISYLVFKSFRYQKIMSLDNDNRTVSLSEDEIEDIPFIPNISITTVPIEAMVSKYYIANRNIDKGFNLLKQAKSVNPYIFYNEFLLGTFYLQSKQIDSAYFYSKKAFFGWPKNLDHYKLFNQILTIKKDTTEIFDTYVHVNKVFNSGDLHHQIFIDSYTKAKMRYMIYEYKDAQSVNLNQLYGEWEQMYEFEGGSINKMDNSIQIDKNFFYSNKNKYKYELVNDTLNLYFITNNKLISQIPVFYSPSYKTLIFKNMIRDLNSDNPDRQDQFFKKFIK